MTSISNTSSSQLSSAAQNLPTSASSTSPRRQRRLLAIYALMLGAWMFDFRSEGAGQGLAIQSVFMLSFFVSCGLFVLHLPRRGLRVLGLQSFLFAVLLFVSISVLSGLLGGQRLYPIFRNAFSVLVYAAAVFATSKMVVLCQLSDLRRVLGWLSLGFAVSSFLIVAVFQGGVDVDKSRYEILGASTFAGLALILLAPIYPLRRIEIAVAFSTAAITFMSVTRTYLVALASQTFVLAPAIKRALRVRTILVLAAGIVVASAMLMSGANVAERWLDRLFVRNHFGGVDPTYLSRASEWEYMWASTHSSLDKMLIGSGFAAETRWYLDKDLGGSGESGSTGFGHSQHLSLLFIGGLMGGVPLLLLQFIQGWWSLQAIRRLTRIGKASPDLAFLSAWGALMIIGTLMSGFFMAHLSNRGTALWYGIATGLLLGSRTLVRRQSGRQINATSKYQNMTRNACTTSACSANSRASAN